MTIGELVAAINGAARLKDDRTQEMMSTAWVTAALVRAKRLPPLKRLLRSFKNTDCAAEFAAARAAHEELMADVRR